jgi:hypothetical protein
MTPTNAQLLPLLLPARWSVEYKGMLFGWGGWRGKPSMQTLNATERHFEQAIRMDRQRTSLFFASQGSKPATQGQR